MKMNVEEKRWQAENDARTLAQAAILRATPIRMAAAKKAAATMAKDAKKDADAMVAVAKTKPRMSSPKSKVKSTSRKTSKKK